MDNITECVQSTDTFFLKTKTTFFLEGLETKNLVSKTISRAMSLLSITSNCLEQLWHQSV